MSEISPPYKNNSQSCSKDFAKSLDIQDPLRHFRDEFIIPSKKDLKRKTLAADDGMYVLPALTPFHEMSLTTFCL